MPVPILAIVGTAVATMGFAFGLPPVSRAVTYSSNSMFPNQLPDPAVLVDLTMRGKLSESEFKALMRKHGYDDVNASRIYEVNKRLIERDALLTLKWRGEINDEEYYKRMETIGWNREQADLYEKAAKYFPSPADLVRFAVREVYTPEIAERYGLFQDLPAKFLEEAKKAGMTEEQARNYWAAHWVLPSVEMGYEMLHRGVISREELETLLRTQDVMPYWRDKLIAISYMPFTRVDVRRMYALGILTEEDVYRSYLDLGYDEEKARAMTAFTVAYSAEDERTLTKTQIRDGWEAGELSDGDTLTLLKSIGYSEANAQYLLSLWKHEKVDKEVKDRINTLQLQFEAGIIDFQTLHDELLKLGLSANRVEYQLTKAVRSRLGKQRLPHERDVMRWFQKKIITEQQLREYLAQMNFREEDIDRYVDYLKRGGQP